MKLFIVSVLSAVAAAQASGVISPLVYTSPVALATPLAVSAPVSTQYHSQDDLGQYSYGYSNAQSAKSEARAANGLTVGGYTYVDPAGKLQSVEYSSDANGFRVAASNLPLPPAVPVAPVLPIPTPVQDTPEVVEARSKHLEAFEAVKARTAEIVAAAPAVTTVVQPSASIVAAAPAPLIAPLAPIAAPLLATKSAVEVPAEVVQSTEAPSTEAPTTPAPVETTVAPVPAAEARSAPGAATLTPAGVSVLSAPTVGIGSLVAPALPVGVAQVLPTAYSINPLYPYGFSSVVAQPAVSTYTTQYVASVPGSIVQTNAAWSPAKKEEQSSE